MAATPGWYLDTIDPAVERYWDGATWSEGPRLASPGTAPFPTEPEPPADLDDLLHVATRQLRQSERAANFLAGIFTLMLLGAIVGVVLGIHSLH